MSTSTPTQSSENARHPDFIVIGAMKSGTTTLYHDLLESNALFLPDKETGCLHSPDSKDRYAHLYRHASDDQLCGEFATTYAMLPDADEVIPRAIATLPPTTKIIYLIREPVKRTLSHHHHMMEWHDETRMGPDINLEVSRRPELIHYSCYAMQVRPWIEAFGADQVMLIPFEEYVRNRRTTIEKLGKFLGVTLSTQSIDPDKAHNKSDGKPIVNHFWGLIIRNPLYRGLVRPFTNQKMRDTFLSLFFPKATQEVVDPSRETLEKMISTFETDITQLQSMTRADKPLWAPNDLRQRYLENYSSSHSG